MLKNTKYKIIVCGTSQKSSEFFEFIKSNSIEGKTRVLNAVQKLSLDEFFLLSQNAITAITVDSLAAHFCAINCNTISFYKNGFGALYFPISNNKVTIIHNHLPSKDSKIMDTIESYYVEDVESKETHELFERIIMNVYKAGKTLQA